MRTRPPLLAGPMDALATPTTARQGARAVKHPFRATEGTPPWIVWRNQLLEVAPQLFPRS